MARMTRTMAHRTRIMARMACPMARLAHVALILVRLLLSETKIISYLYTFLQFESRGS